uniref:Uncharacterized protein n=1 Tax=Ditylenchus dipsaci TaxID=166011 RepID=A0A915END5_9BILA
MKRKGGNEEKLGRKSEKLVTKRNWLCGEGTRQEQNHRNGHVVFAVPITNHGSLQSNKKQFAKAQLTASALGQFPPGTIPYQPPVDPNAGANLQAYQGLQGLQGGIPGLQGLQSQLSQLQQLQALQGLTAGLGGAAGAVPNLGGLSAAPPLSQGLQPGLANGLSATFIPLGQVLIPTGKEVVRNPQSNNGYGSNGGNFNSPANNFNCNNGGGCGGEAWTAGVADQMAVADLTVGLVVVAAIVEEEIVVGVETAATMAKEEGREI